MKKLTLLAALCLAFGRLGAQQAYWVFLSDKAGAVFDPYTYFDAKAIDRYRQCGADLYDITNYPVSTAYETGVAALATEEIGASRWMNAVGVMATPDQAAAIGALPYVLRVQPIEACGMRIASAADEAGLFDKAVVDGPLEAQLVRMGGQLFRDKGIDGKGVRVAVFDGGFPQVNTHNAFRHLRDEGRILKTWNFPNRKENVYGWNSHGTMTLSCIAGRMGDKDLGLATGAEFLLARTEVEAEPFKEEVWWQMAVEWADKNGANIISSSLGYGKERHYTKDMDGTSYVAKAGNLAARKGILVCNSAGNEASDRQWRTIITPSDADSVLCVGGIENSLENYHHIEFSSLGPSADGRLKPNVCAFGYARTANVGGDDRYHYVHGTSFSCPLVAGFAACAWQASPGRTAMEMFRLIEQSADLYPYYDYAFGYGVPQASFFVGAETDKAEPAFLLTDTDDKVLIEATRPLTGTTLFYHLRDHRTGELAYYASHDIAHMGTGDRLAIDKAALYHRTLVVRLDGQIDSLRLADDVAGQYAGKSFSYGVEPWGGIVSTKTHSMRGRTTPSNWGSNAPWRTDWYLQLGTPVKTASAEVPMLAWSPAAHVGMRVMHAFGKVYCIGIGLEWGGTTFNYRGMQYNKLEEGLGADLVADGMDRVRYRRAHVYQLGGELFQRVRLVPLGLAGKGLHWDLGVYATYGYSYYSLRGKVQQSGLADRLVMSFENPHALMHYSFNYGLSTRLSYDVVGIYARYRLNGIGSEPGEGDVLMPRLEVGLQLQF